MPEDQASFGAKKESVPALGKEEAKEREGNLGIEGREAFCYTGKPHLQLHHLYVCPADSEELRRHITFREFLRQNPDAVKWYSSVKEQAAQRFPDDIERYLEYKSPCIAELYRICGLED